MVKVGRLNTRIHYHNYFAVKLAVLDVNCCCLWLRGGKEGEEFTLRNCLDTHCLSPRLWFGFL